MEQRTSVAQDELIAFLLDPESYPHHPKRVCLVQTHASYVFLGFPYVYKVKKEVNFGFLDFSSLENRRYYSEREVILNRRLCPEIYPGVIPISLLAGKLTFGEGEKDFDHHNRPDLSRELAARMADALRDNEMLRLMDFYKCYRTYVRGKVESFHQARAEVPETEKKKSRMQARRYFRLALRYAVCGSKPTVLIVMGRIASGKSTLARALGRELGFEVFSSDRVRKELAGVPLYERDEKSARRLYSEAMTRETYKTLFQCAASQLDRDASVILDATFGRRQHRDELSRLLDSKGATYRFIEAQAPDEVLKRRLEQRKAATQEISDARLENFETLTRSYEPLSEVGTDHCFQVATDRTATVTIEETLKKLALRCSLWVT